MIVDSVCTHLVTAGNNQSGMPTTHLVDGQTLGKVDVKAGKGAQVGEVEQLNP